MNPKYETGTREQQWWEYFQAQTLCNTCWCPAQLVYKLLRNYHLHTKRKFTFPTFLPDTAVLWSEASKLKNWYCWELRFSVHLRIVRTSLQPVLHASSRISGVIISDITGHNRKTDFSHQRNLQNIENGSNPKCAWREIEQVGTNKLSMTWHANIQVKSMHFASEMLCPWYEHNETMRVSITSARQLHSSFLKFSLRPSRLFEPGDGKHFSPTRMLHLRSPWLYSCHTNLANKKLVDFAVVTCHGDSLRGGSPLLEKTNKHKLHQILSRKLDLTWILA